MSKKLIMIITVFMLLSFFYGCIPLEGLGKYWDKGVIDPKLEGHWKDTAPEYRIEDKYTSFTKKGDHYEVNNIDISNIDFDAPLEICKTIYIGKHAFLMIDVEEHLHRMNAAALRKAEKEFGQAIEPNDTNMPDLLTQLPLIGIKGALKRYIVTDNTLTFYDVNIIKLTEAVKKGKLKGKVFEGEDEIWPVVLGVLDESIINFISNIADDPNWWEKGATLTRVTDLKKAIEESLTYPATAQTEANTTFDINFPNFSYFAQGKTDIIIRALETMPDWKVHNEGREMVCTKRIRRYDTWDEGSNGFLSNFFDAESKEDYYQIRWMFRFSKEPFGFHAVWARQPYVMKLGPTADKTQIKLKKYDQGIESYLAIGQEGLWFEVMEQTHKEPRIYTRQALDYLGKFLRDVRSNEREIETQGYSKKLVDANAVRTGAPSMQVAEEKSGRYNLKAWVNPGSRGLTYLKIFDANGTAITKDYQELGFDEKIRIRYGSEYIGFSNSPQTLFAYEQDISSWIRYPERTGKIKIELWFAPKDSEKDRKLLETTYYINPRN